MIEYSKEKGRPFLMYNVTPEYFEQLNEWYPERFQIEYDRDSADYVYESEKLATLSGKNSMGNVTILTSSKVCTMDAGHMKA